MIASVIKILNTGVYFENLENHLIQLVTLLFYFLLHDVVLTLILQDGGGPFRHRMYQIVRFELCLCRR